MKRSITTMNDASPPTAPLPLGVPPIEEGARWSIWIDIEGFSKLWSEGRLAIRGLQALMSGIYAIGTKVYPDDGSRLFAHQFGDGFVIVADFHESDLDRCAAIAVALMRHVSKAGCLARAAIAEGEFADISGLWPREIREAEIRDGSQDVLQLGSGLLTLLPVMGTALINANKLDSSNPLKGSILTVSTDNASRVSSSFPRILAGDAGRFTVLDWIHATSPMIDDIFARSGVGREPAETKKAVRQYIADQRPPLRWIEGTSTSNNIS